MTLWKLWSRKRKDLHEVEDNPNIVLFSDLDGTLLSSDTYKWEEAREGVELCKKLGVPVVLVSSKTRAEMESIREDMGLSSPFVSENGGAIFIESDDPHGLKGATASGRYKKLELGIPYQILTEALKKIKEELGWNIKGFSDMSVKEISYVTGLDLPSAYLASLREYDEPFLILDNVKDISPLLRLATGMGLKVFKGGRFYHIQGENDKGKAVDVLISWYKKKMGNIITAGLGDSPNDFPMLNKVDYPVLIASEKRYQPPIPRLKISTNPGPKGWNEEVISIIKRLYNL